MKNVKKLLILSSSALLLMSCSPVGPDGDSKVSSEVSSSEDSSAKESESEDRGEWTSEQAQTILSYCGEVLPFPLGFDYDITAEIVVDDNNVPFLQITNSTAAFTIADYYKDLEKEGWSAIRDYNGNIEQATSTSEQTYELTKISEGVGYDLTYYFYSEGDTFDDAKYNVIQVYNAFDSQLDGKTSWTEEEKGIFYASLLDVPPLLKLGSANRVGSSGNDYVYCYDVLAQDLTKENVKILQEGGYVLDEGMSKSRGSYILKKELEAGASIYASLYFQSGNIITFTYEAKKEVSASWPKEFVSSFETKTGFVIPEFKADVYYTYKKGDVYTLYGTSSDTSIPGTFDIAMDNTSAVYDMEKNWYTDWAETFYIQTNTGYVNSQFAFSISFASISSYDEIVEGWPDSKISDFLSASGISVSCPALDFTPYSDYSTCRVSSQSYADMYEKCLAIVKGDPENYVGKKDPTEEEIQACASELAKERTWMKVKVYDPLVKEGDATTFKANDYLISALKKAGWAKVDSEEGVGYEDPTGSLLLVVSLSKDVSVVKLTYGSGKTHTPTFAFDEENIELTAGSSYYLQYTVDMLPYEITFSSDNEKVTVGKDGLVKVASDAYPGSVATITASIDVPGEGKKTITCTITVLGKYTAKGAIEEVASKYNAHYNLSSTDEGAAKVVANGEGFVYYTINAPLTDISTVKDAKSFVASTLIPDGFSGGEWSEGQLPNEQGGYATNAITYTLYDRDTYTTVNLIFAVYKDGEGRLNIKVTATQF